jgi:protein-disulfide isomerase
MKKLSLGALAALSFGLIVAGLPGPADAGAKKISVGAKPAPAAPAAAPDCGGCQHGDDCAAGCGEAEHKLTPEESAKVRALLEKGASADEIARAVGRGHGGQAPADEGPVAIDIGASPIRGAAHAPVTLVVFSDFQCPYCSRANATVAALREKYGDRLRFVFKHSPLPFHPNARPAAVASMAAGAQGRFWEMHDALFASQRELDRPHFVELAGKLGLDTARFQADLDSGRFDAQIDADSAQARKVGATGTPTFFVNGKRLVGAQPQSAFEAVIDAAL